MEKFFFYKSAWKLVCVAQKVMICCQNHSLGALDIVALNYLSWLHISTLSYACCSALSLYYFGSRSTVWSKKVRVSSTGLRQFRPDLYAVKCCETATVDTKGYAECQDFYPVVRIGSPRPLTRKRVLRPLWFRVGGHSLGGANSDEGTDTLVLYKAEGSEHWAVRIRGQYM